MLCVAVFYFIVYVALNHILIRRVISNKFLLMVEALLFVSMLTLVISDMSYEAFRHKRYLESIESTDSEVMQMNEQINGRIFEDLSEELQRAVRLNERLKLSQK